MAKALVHYYSFDPTTNTVRIQGNIAKERLLLITNVTDNITIFSFADNTLGATSYYDSDTDQTVITLDYNCNQMSLTDKLQIFWEMDHVEFEPSETFVDPVSKFRVSNPENLVDTDFEYGPQASKWETLQLINQIPSFFSSTADTTISFIEAVESTVGSELITVTTGFDHNLTSGTPITVTGLTSITAEGTYLIQSVPSSTTFTYKARAKQLNSAELQGTYTSIIPGQFFQGSQVSVDTAIGITSDYFEINVIGKLVTEIRLNSSPNYTWEVGEEVTNGLGASGILVKKSNSIITLNDISGTFSDGEVLSIVGSSNTYVIDTTVAPEPPAVAAPDYRFFIDGALQPNLNLKKKSIYRFDISDTSIIGHTFEFSETEDGTNNGGTEYTTFVYKFGSPGTSGSYVRIYVTNSTPQLYYYCGYGAGHENEGGQASAITANETKVLLRTESEHGFADNTNFYFVNSISPKALDVVDPTAIAPDGAPFVDPDDQRTFVGNVDSAQTIPYDNESTYTVRFGVNDVDYGTDTITIPDHNFQNGYALLYYPSPGDIPIGGLNRMQVYYVQRVDANNIRLHDSQRINLLKNLSVGGTWNYGSHTLGLCYNVYREYKTWGDFYAYFYTYYWYYNSRGYPTASGHDFSSNTTPYNTTFGLGGQAWDFVAYFSNSRPGYSGHNQFLYNYEWYQRFGTYWRTYGYHLQTLPLTSNAVYQGGYDFITDNDNWGVAGNNNYGYGYTVGGYNRVNGRSYWTSTFWGEFMNSDYLRLYGNETTYWAYQGNTDGWWASRDGYRDTNDRYFNNIESDGNTNMYFMLCKRNTSTNDSFYAPSHGFQTNYPLILTVNSGNGILYWNNTTNGTARYNNGSTFFADRVDENRFRIKTSTSATPVRVAAADGQYVFNSTVVNPTKNSVYISNNQFSNGELILVTKELTGTIISGLIDNSTYYFRAINGNRFQLLQNPSDSDEIDFTSSGSGIHTFENASASFGAVDGSYTTTKAVDEFTLEITLPFKISPGTKSFDGSVDVDATNNLIIIANHYFSTGTKIIYSANGNTELGGLSDNTDYYVIVKDDLKIQIAESVEDAIAGNAIDITAASTGVHRLVTANLSGLITGAGTISLTNGSRKIVGTATTFKRYFKIGDIITIIDTSTSPTGTLYERRITAIKDDSELLVETAIDFTNSSAKYFIPTYIYVRPDGYFLHRPFDGGMEIGTSKSPDGLICRQTRKYFRYQSGKGIQTSFAINFIPQNQIVLLSYTPQGTPGTYSFTGNTGESIVTVDEGTANLVANMEIESGVGVDNSCTILLIIDENTVELSLPLTEDIVSEPIVLSEGKFSTIRSQRPHNLEDGTIISISQSDVNQYNGDFAVTEILNDFEFRILVKDLPNNISASGGFPQFGVKRWTNSAVRAGMFDFQNGFFFEYDGEYINCVRRSSVQQLTGTLSVTLNSGVVSGVDTLFTSQLSIGDKVVIRGMTHKVVKIRNNTEMVIQPAYRGVTNSNVVGTKTIDVKIAQPEWNIDKCDGNGPSGFHLDVNRIQMCYADYSWYGAGKIRFGFKDQKGHVKYVHEFKHNNKLRESYFRSGNLPARYEIENTGTPSFVPSLFHWGTSVIMDGTFQDDEAYLFTASGDVQKFTNASTQTSSSNGNSIILEQRISSFNSIYFIRIPFAASEASKLTVNTLIFQNTAGNGFFADGRVIGSRSFTSGSVYYVYVQYLLGSQSVFPRNYGSTIQSQLGGTISSGTAFNVGARAGSENLIPSYMPLLSIRLAPSVDSSITGALGQREIINRMQLALESVGVQVTHDSEISLILNPELSTDAYENVSSPSLCQLVRHAPNETISGGQRILSFRAAGGASNKSATTVYDLSQLSSLGNSILGGDGVYPNGPDLLCISCEVIDSTGVSTSVPYSVSARITWKESQA
jgi:hypothetical protein